MDLWCCVAYLLAFRVVHAVRYEPNWNSIDSRPLPTWYDEAKLGIFIHWGVFSVPSFGSPWFWWHWKGDPKPDIVNFVKKNYPSVWTYADFAGQFTAEFFDPIEWLDIFNASGARYIVLTSKHHEGFTMWPSKYSFNWNAGAVGPRRDLVGELAGAIRDHSSMHFGLYHSLFEWFNPIYVQDAANNYTTNNFVQMKSLPELYEIVNNYKPDILWSDGDIGPDCYWNSTVFLSWLYNESPVKDTVVVNDRWCTGCHCTHGGYFTCHDRFNPGVLLPHKWENCMTIDRYSWSYRRNSELKDYLSIEELLQELASTVSCGGNLLVNVAPTHDGRIVPIFEERLRQLGSWMDVNGEAIYASRPWKHQNDTATPHIWYTSTVNVTDPSGYNIYAIVLKWPTSQTLILGAPVSTSGTTVYMLGYGTPLHWSYTNGALQVVFPHLSPSTLPCKWAWVLKINSLKF